MKAAGRWAAFAWCLAACGGARDGTPRNPSDVPTPLAAIAYESCALPVVGEASARVVASIAPQGIEWVGARSDAEWSPTSVTDVQPLGDSLVVLDGPQSLLSVFNGRLEQVASFGAPGEGPGEFRRASALATLDDGRIAVADPGNQRLTILTPTFAFAEARPFDAGQVIDGIAFSDADIYVTRTIMPEMAARSPALGDALTVLRAGEERGASVLRLVPGTAAADSLLRLPGPNAFRVVADSRIVLLIAPAAGMVDLFRDGVRTARLRTCMPPALDTALITQRAAYQMGSGSGSQQSIPLVSDAMVIGDTVFLVGPVATTAGRLHIDAYHLNGTPIGSVLVDVRDLRLPSELKFWGSPEQLVAFGTDGVIMKLALSRAPRDDTAVP